MTNYPFEIEIDKLIRSVENVISGEVLKTKVTKLTGRDIRFLNACDWLFDWKAEAKQKNKTVYKLTIVRKYLTIQGLISLEDRGDHIFMSLIESNKLNRGSGKLYLGVPGNLVAFACKLSFEKGYEGYVSFESKSKLKEHYCETLGAHVLFGNIMALDTRASRRLVARYFPENL